MRSFHIEHVECRCYRWVDCIFRDPTSLECNDKARSASLGGEAPEPPQQRPDCERGRQAGTLLEAKVRGASGGLAGGVGGEVLNEH